MKYITYLLCHVIYYVKNINVMNVLNICQNVQITLISLKVCPAIVYNILHRYNITTIIVPMRLYHNRNTVLQKLNTKYILFDLSSKS